MRLLVALSLVIACAAILVFVLFSVGEDDAPRELPLAPLVEQRTPSGSPEDLGGEEVPAVSPGEQGPGPIAQAREEVGGALSAYENALVGTVRDPEGAPVAEVRLTLEEGDFLEGGMEGVRRTFGAVESRETAPRTTVTDEQGQYRFRELVPGRYSLEATHPEYSRSRSLLIVGSRGETTHDVSLKTGVLLQGYVRTTRGEPIPDSSVELLEFSLEVLLVPGSKEVLTKGQVAAADDKGYYRFTNVSAVPDLHLVARAPGYGTQTSRDITVDTTLGITSLDFRLSPGQSIAGRVLGPSEQPIADAIVEVFGYQEPQSFLTRATTSAEGRFEITDLVAGPYFLRAEAKGFSDAQMLSVEAPSEVDVRMSETGLVRGRVVGPEGEPVTRFAATLHPFIDAAKTYGRAVAPQTSFDAPDGAFSLSGGAAGSCVVRVEAEGFAPGVSSPFAIAEGGATEGVVVELGNGGTITGRVVDASTGEGISGATVFTRDNNYRDNVLTRMASQGSVQHTTARQAHTDKAGGFVLDLLTPETYQLVVRHPRYAEWTQRDIAVVASDTSDVGTLELEAGAVVQGKVLDELGQAVIGAIVKITPAGKVPFSAETVSGSDGAYALLNVPPGSYSVFASRGINSSNAFQNIDDMQNSKVEVRVTRGGEHTQDLYVASR